MSLIRETFRKINYVYNEETGYLFFSANYAHQTFPVTCYVDGIEDYKLTYLPAYARIKWMFNRVLIKGELWDCSK